jgi:hypothetical protein
MIWRLAYPRTCVKGIIPMIYHQNPHYGIGFEWNELDFSVVAMEAWSGRRVPEQVYHQIPTTEEPAPSCFLSCLERYADSKGRALQMEPVGDMLFATYKGEASARENWPLALNCGRRYQAFVGMTNIPFGRSKFAPG